MPEDSNVIQFYSSQQSVPAGFLVLQSRIYLRSAGTEQCRLVGTYI